MLIFYSFLFFFCFYCSGDHRDLHSFPTRRSSDLPARFTRFRPRAASRPSPTWAGSAAGSRGRRTATCACAIRSMRSEEHTSELQSLRHLVCRLLLEKKKKKNINSKSNENNKKTYL